MAVVLPGGWLDTAGRVHRHVTLAPVRGRDEELVNSYSESASPWTWFPDILQGRIVAIDDGPPPPGIARSLLACDAEYLALHLYASSFNDLPMIVQCPHDGCGVTAEVCLDPARVPIAACPPQPRYQLDLGGRRVTFRLPRVDDVRSVVCSPPDGNGQGMSHAAILARRCVVEAALSGSEAGADGHAVLDDDLVAALDDAIEQATPRLPQQLPLSCPGCERDLWFAFDPLGLLAAAVRRDEPDLTASVHLLSSRYHWSLHEILELTRKQRQRWVNVLLDAWEGRVTPLESAGLEDDCVAPGVDGEDKEVPSWLATS